MAAALKASGRPRLIQVVEEEEKAFVKRPKVLEVGDGTGMSRAIL